jgi:hypothetical protein
MEHTNEIARLLEHRLKSELDRTSRLYQTHRVFHVAGTPAAWPHDVGVILFQNKPVKRGRGHVAGTG